MLLLDFKHLIKSWIMVEKFLMFKFDKYMCLMVFILNYYMYKLSVFFLKIYSVEIIPSHLPSIIA